MNRRLLLKLRKGSLVKYAWATRLGAKARDPECGPMLHVCLLIFRGSLQSVLHFRPYTTTHRAHDGFDAMSETQASVELSAVSNGEEDPTLKQAACLPCRKSKIKCVRASDAPACKRCEHIGVRCIVPDYHVGRYKGVKNKRSGLEKALYQVEEAVKKARTTGSLTDGHTQTLRRLLDYDQIVGGAQEPAGREAVEHDRFASQEVLAAPEDVAYTSTSDVRQSHHSLRPGNDDTSVTQHPSSALIDNNASNPLQLLAMASSIPDAVSTSIQQVEIISHSHPRKDVTPTFFSPTKSRLDISDDYDPIELGLVTASEAEMLFAYFHNTLSHTRWGCDRTISLDFVRSRSCFLLTSILAAASLFNDGLAALSKRLTNHCKYLIKEVISENYKSVEIVLALMVNVPWHQPGKSWNTDDRTCFYISTAMSIATDLSMNKIIIPTSTIRTAGTMHRLTQAETIDARRALHIDGHADIEPNSTLGRRLLRARERAWLALFTLDRGVCLARGRPWTLPVGPLIETCDAWHVSDIADANDSAMIASCVLRRDFGSLISNVRSLCDNHQTSLHEDAGIVRLLREKIEGFFTQWYNTWWHQIQQPNGEIPAYIDIIRSHGKLSAYCNVLNHPTAPSEVKHFFRSAGLTSALEVLHVAIRKEEQLLSMPNNSVIMLSFAACFVVGLSTTRAGGKVFLASHVRNLVEKAADVLIRLGTTPSHRNGASTLFGKHIKDILGRHVDVGSPATIGSIPFSQPGDMMFSPTRGPMALPPTLHTASIGADQEYLGFDSMTDDQLLKAIQNADVNLDQFSSETLAEDNIFMDWLDWPNIS